LQIPPRQRMLARFYRRFFRTHYPELAAIPYSRTGLPVNTSIGRIFASKLAHRLTGQPGQAQKPWTEWLRHDLGAMLQSRLLDKGSIITDVIPTTITQARVNALKDGDASATMAVGQLLSLESFLRQFKPSL